MFGFFNIDKPPHISSYDVIRHLKRTLAAGRAPGQAQLKFGHAGTLDPMAEGVLIVCVGAATRLADVVHEFDKEYVTAARLGATSTTDDAEGDVTENFAALPPTPEALAGAVRELTGTIMQVPPAHSAVHINGQRAYELARSGHPAQLAPKSVTVYELEVIEHNYPLLRLRVRCGSGTYIRSLVRDLGQRLGVGAYCEQLIRTRIGPFLRADSLALAALEKMQLAEHLISPLAAVPPERRVTLADDQLDLLRFGRAIDIAQLVPPGVQPAAAGATWLAAVTTSGQLAALLRPDWAAGKLLPSKVLLGAD